MKMSKCHLFSRRASIAIIRTPRTRVDSRGNVKVTPVLITKHCNMLLGLLVRGKFIGAKRHTATLALHFEIGFLRRLRDHAMAHSDRSFLFFNSFSFPDDFSLNCNSGIMKNARFVLVKYIRMREGNETVTIQNKKKACPKR
jgi:hypothetical protein